MKRNHQNLKQKTSHHEKVLQDLSGKGKKQLSRRKSLFLPHYRRTRSKTMSERLRKSIRQKLRPSIFTVSIMIINLLHSLELMLGWDPELFHYESIIPWPWINSYWTLNETFQALLWLWLCRKVLNVLIVCLSKLEKRQVTLASPVKNVESILELHTT